MSSMLERPVNELLREAPQMARVFDSLAIEYSCGNGRTLAEACREHQLDPKTVESALAAAGPVATDPFVTLRLGALADEIVTRHHSYVQESGPRIQQLLNRVCMVHGSKEPRLLVIWSLFRQMHGDLVQHMLKEESVLFPYCKQLELASESVNMHCGSVANPIRVMESEHRETRDQIKELRALSDGFSPPDWACNSFRVLYHELEAYCEDLETHMHLENDLLFPAALRREDELKAGSKSQSKD